MSFHPKLTCANPSAAFVVAMEICLV